MENLKFSVFDIFAYFLPGAVVLTAIVLFSTPTNVDISQYLEMAKGISIGLGIVIVFIAYILGNVADNFGSWIYYKVGCKIWGNPHPKGGYSTLSHAKQRALIRQYSPENFSFVHTWKVLKNMSHNMSFAMLLIVVASFIRYSNYHAIEWLIISVVSLVFSIVLLHRASVYDKWHYKELFETIEILRLEERVGLDFVNKPRNNEGTENA